MVGLIYGLICRADIRESFVVVKMLEVGKKRRGEVIISGCCVLRIK